VRENFATAKAEIETLQRQIGFVDYSDAATGVTPIAVGASTWVKLTNEKLGPNTKIDAMPEGVTNLWNNVTNQLVLTELPVDTMVEARADLIVTTTAANQVVKFRTLFAIGDPIQFDVEGAANQFKTAGAQKMVLNGSFYIGSEAVRLNPAEFQLWSDAACTVRVNGWYIRVIKHLGD
jgi:hypothetical protein